MASRILAVALVAMLAIGAQALANVKFGGSKIGGFDSKVPGVVPNPTLPANNPSEPIPVVF